MVRQRLVIETGLLGRGNCVGHLVVAGPTAKRRQPDPEFHPAAPASMISRTAGAPSRLIDIELYYPNESRSHLALVAGR
jgi:hypothetical protein